MLEPVAERQEGGRCEEVGKAKFRPFPAALTLRFLVMGRQGNLPGGGEFLEKEQGLW